MKYFVVPIPFNKEGNGPEMEPEKIVRTNYEIWDDEGMTMAICFEKENAEIICKLLNESQNYE